MKKTFLLTLSSLTVATFMTACGQSIPYINTDTVDECATVDKKLLKVDNFIKVVNGTSAFHLEEAASAIPVPGITASNNKPRMLKDADKRKAQLVAERQSLGCEAANK